MRSDNRSRTPSVLLSAAMSFAGIALAGAAWRKITGPGPDYFREKVVLITGGSRGLGLELARLFADEGARIAITARNPEEMERAARELRERGAEVLTVQADLTVPEQARQAVEETAAHFGNLHVLINNAGVIQVGPMEHMTTEDYEYEMALHFRAPLETMRAAVPHMRRTLGGRIVNITSFGGMVAVPHMAPYTASKFAEVGLSNAFRTELAPHNIRVTTVAPGPMTVGSHLRAQFKGQHSSEFAWFSNLAGLPVQSTPSDRAAKRIVEACRRGDPELLIGLPTRLMVLADTLAPNLTAWGLEMMNRTLPGTSEDSSGDQARPGMDLRSEATETPLLRRANRAGMANNEV